MDPVQRTEQWIAEVVVELGLCPFARLPFEADRVRVVMDATAEPERWLATLDREADRLLAAEATELETTLIVLPEAPAEFVSFLEVLRQLEAHLRAEGHEGVLQLVGFHPDYEFGDAPREDPANATNRSPYPTLHLLLEASIGAAVEQHPDPDSIWRRNQRVLRGLDPEVLERFRKK